MDSEANKQAAIDFVIALGLHDAARIDGMLRDDATYWSSGTPRLFPPAGEKSKADICRMMRAPSMFDGGLGMTFGAVVAEGDLVSLEARSQGATPDGRVYTNDYHFLFAFRDGRIASVREYMDTQRAAEFFLG